MGDKPNFHILHWHRNGYAHGDGASHATAITCTMSENQKIKNQKSKKKESQPCRWKVDREKFTVPDFVSPSRLRAGAAP
jgi:hypothetical protein